MTAQPEFSRVLAVEGLTPDKVRKETVEANAKECAALAKRFDLRELSNFKADLRIRRVEGGDVVRLEGKLSADVVQTCVISLQDVHAHIDGEFDTFLAEGGKHTAKKFGDEADFGIDDDDTAPEVIHNGQLDLGEIVAQYLSVELDPYPRAPGVSLAAQLAEAGLEVKNNPFSVLKNLNPQDKSAPKPGAKSRDAERLKIIAENAGKSKKGDGK
ncbi:MAG: DUF177 domain-containing protein [Alphaproteobacteria bacterium]|nr:DUF177 domain-containing protein [Alphaproteobacteria bacterium]